MPPGSTCFLGTTKTDGKDEYCESRGSQVEVAFADLNAEEGKNEGGKNNPGFQGEKKKQYIPE